VKHINHIAIGVALLATAAGCGGDESGPLGNVDSLVILQRAKRPEGGDIFQYTSYVPGARLVTLTPPTADGTLQTIFPSPALLAGPDGAMYQDVDVSSYDISFDAKQIVFSARTNQMNNYGLFILTIADGSVDPLGLDAGRDYVNPIFLPGDRIMFNTNEVVEAGAPQHLDEYERGVTLQLGVVDVAGTNLNLGPRNLSHRTYPSLVSDGRIIYTQWDHLGEMNAGHLQYSLPDMTDNREAFGKEGTEASNSTLKAREISEGRYVAIATARSRTIQAGALIDIRLGTVVDDDGIVSAGDKQAEARATYHLLTPDVPLGNEPSADTIGRYYDAFPLNAKDKPDLLVSWCDGACESGVLAAAGIPANFGVYLLDTARNQRLPILDDPEMWDIFARPLQTRTAPPIVGSATDPTLEGSAMIGALDVYQSTIAQFQPGEIYGVRVAEGFSSEEGFPRMFGTTEFEGQASLGVAPVASDNSWLAKVPANVPLHLQAINKFGLSVQNEPIWFSARKNEARLCGGCHEDRTATTNVLPGQLEAFSIGATDMFSLTPRLNRELAEATPITRDSILGVPWAPASTVDPGNTSGVSTAKTVQNIFNNHCIGCHNASAPTLYTITDPVTGQSVEVKFDLTDRLVNMNLGDAEGGVWPSSYAVIAGPDMEAIEEGNLMVTGEIVVYMNPQDARGSTLIKKLNPPQIFPQANMSVRAFPGAVHLIEQGQPDMTAAEYYMLILAADLGVNYYARENRPNVNAY
jgi:hypothetical protein